ncbi:tRNA (adenosine(37)-N6)-threonylcarbamoyltransferase complex ATPase subunit type 1 TsaE [Natronoglycomyces albus]|uniref:tRNA threonylcarbamoyladenosine biosynthesis protein TsaE n=1 Tax=Natronoglycomyces albus TaxID=2811108 RepID=A0A895XTD3_9ACTN|nr:tRNA (adenosine(37)-N6)-threonylcarbamoyltransferase complex ATPase subunit type 1 TsaE [Natronoglycomyces albus]QSB05796.1 tRNA (adenosine(37)-N6)-threonylcarbamoyltransferase complex ATPase subunit type 1 TsaE [Natronoglycomyces albus]
MKIEMPKAEDTHMFGTQLADVLRPGDLVILTGDLGAGKTALTKGIGAGLGVSGTITSPTFVIARTHRGGQRRIPLVHVDAYRLGGLEELDDLDLDTDVATSVTCVEWGAGLAERLSEAHLEIKLVRRADDVREIELLAHGGDWTQRLAAFAHTLSCADHASAIPAQTGAESETHPSTDHHQSAQKTPAETNSARQDRTIGAAC